MHIDKKTLRNIFIGVALCIILYWILNETEQVNAVIKTISNVTFPFVLGASIAFILNVPLRAVENMLKGIKKSGLRRGLSILITFTVVLLILALIILLLIPQIGDTVRALIPKLFEFADIVENFVITSINNNPDLMQMIGSELKEFDWSGLAQDVLKVAGTSITAIIAGAFSAIATASSILMDVVIAIVFSVYCLFQKETLARQGRKLLYAFLPEKVADYIVRVMRLTNSTFSNFFAGQCLEVVILGCMFAITMSLFRMPYVPLVSVLIAVTAFIPVVGAWVGCVLGAFFILVANPMQAVWFVVMFVVLQQIENNLIYPRVVGTSIGLSGMWVLIAVGVGGALMGVAGMFLMIPIVSVVYTLLTEHTNQRLRYKTIDPEKLKAHPPEIYTIRERQQMRKAKLAKIKAQAQAKENNKK